MTYRREMSHPPRRISSKIKRKGISKSTAITSLVVGGFVALVVVGLVYAYVIPPSTTTATTTSPPLSFTGLTLQSGTASTLSYSKGCSGDAELDLSVSSFTNATIYLTNVTIYGPKISVNGTTLVPTSGGCIPVDQSLPPIEAYSDDLVIATFPNIPLPLGTACTVIMIFSDGQNLTQDLLAQAE